MSRVIKEAEKRKDPGLTAKSVLNDGPELLAKIEEILDTKFPYKPGQLQQAEVAFDEQYREEELGYRAPNKILAEAIPAYRDILSVMADSLAKLEGWLLSSINIQEKANGAPLYVMQEDQLSSIKELREMIVKNMTDLIQNYYLAQVDAGGGLGYTATTIFTEEVVTKSPSLLTTDDGPSVGSKIPVFIGPGQYVAVPMKDDMEGGTETQPITVERVKSTGKLQPLSSYRNVKAYITLDVNLYSNMMLSLVHCARNYEACLGNCRKLHILITKPVGGCRYFVTCFKSYMGC